MRRSFIRVLVFLLLLSTPLSTHTDRVYAKKDSKTESKDNKKDSKKDKKKDKKDTEGATDTSEPSSTDDANTTTVSTVTGTIQIQDGRLQEKKADCYTKNESIPRSYEGDYYDVMIPYNATIGDLKGTPTKSGSGGGQDWHPLTEEESKWSPGGTLNREEDYSGSTRYGMKIEKDAKTGMNYVDIGNGVRAHVAAIGAFLYGKEGAWYGYSDANRAQLFDVILTDGTIIHFAVGDCFGEGHMLGGDPNTGQGGISRAYTEMPRKFYRGITYGADPYQLLELWYGGDAMGAFRDKYDLRLKVGEGNKVAYIRMYEAKATNAKVLSGVPSGYDFNGGTVTTVGSGTADGTTDSGSGGVGFSGSGTLMNESDFVKIQEDSAEGAVDFATGEEFTTVERVNFVNLKQDTKKDTTKSFVHWLGSMVSFVGIIISLYAILLYSLYWFDRVNPFFDYSVVGVLTLGKFRTSYDGESTYANDGVQQKEVNDMDMLKVSLISFGFGMILMTGFGIRLADNVLSLGMKLLYALQSIVF